MYSSWIIENREKNPNFVLFCVVSASDALHMKKKKIDENVHFYRSTQLSTSNMNVENLKATAYVCIL